MSSLPQLIARELSLPDEGVGAVLALLESGGTVPFIARYRKEATGALDEVQIRAVQARHSFHLELSARKRTILAAIDSQGKLTDELRAKIEACDTRSVLEDLYLPYKKKRRTKAAIARERGLEPLATLILRQPTDQHPRQAAAKFVDPSKDVPDAEAALAGARDIVAEAIAESPMIRGLVRDTFAKHGQVCSAASKTAAKTPTKFEDYYDYSEPVTRIPSHRYLAIRRGETDGVLRVKVEVDRDRLVGDIERTMGLRRASPFAAEFSAAIGDGYKRLLAPSVENEIRAELKHRSDAAAVEVFADNLRALLLAAPLGAKPVLGIDPGIRTGSKCVALGATGRYLGYDTIFIDRRTEEASKKLAKLVDLHGPEAVAVGNGTGGRETEAFVRKVLADRGLKHIVVVQVNEAGASVYSASDIAREEFGDLDLTLRGAISIGRRLQDPLAELVKIDPKAIGVGQYQHDVHQPLLIGKLDEVVSSCVNHVGVDLNTASAPLLAHVAGVGPKLAKNIVQHRDAKGPFSARRQLLDIPGLGKKAFEQASGFCRIFGAKNPLDASAVHPERYPLVQRIAQDLGLEVAALVGDAKAVSRIDARRYLSDGVGALTMDDIVEELKKPGRDPRDRFDPPKFRDDVNSLADLKPDMILEGVVTNVTDFGAFVDIGVHQDGLVHVSKLKDQFVRDPRQAVKAGQRLEVRVVSVDMARKRISLTAKPSEVGG